VATLTLIVAPPTHGAGTPAEVAFDVNYEDHRLDGLSR
jgi:hypothetical protein